MLKIKIALALVILAMMILPVMIVVRSRLGRARRDEDSGA
jgi:hypothetical protein